MGLVMARRRDSGKESGHSGHKGSLSDRDRAMSSLAGRQDGVVSLLQLFELGFSYGTGSSGASYDRAGAIDDLLALLAA